MVMVDPDQGLLAQGFQNFQEIFLFKRYASLGRGKILFGDMKENCAALPRNRRLIVMADGQD